jgi:hypothetical protein
VIATDLINLYIFIEIINGSSEVLVYGIIYAPPKSKIYDNLEPILNILVEMYDKVLICDAFNVNLLSNNKTTIPLD